MADNNITTVDTNTNTVIDMDNVTYTSNNDIVQQTNTSWQLIPASSVSEESKNIPSSTYGLDSTEDADITTVTKLKYQYSLKPESSHITYGKSSGMISEPITLTNFNYICIDADVTLNDTSSVEFSIVDGTSEYPILPISCDTVERERLYDQVDTRFSIDTSKTVTIYKNGEVYSDSWAAFDTSLLSTNDIYTISYTPLTESHKVVPSHTSVQMKVVVLINTDEGYPPEISNIILYKCGGTIEWIY